MERPEDQFRVQSESGLVCSPVQIISDQHPSADDRIEPGAQETELRVTVSNDGMEALLSLNADPPEPYPFALEDIEQALEKRGVVEGILFEEIRRILENQELGSDFVVARGIAAEEGEDAIIEFFFDTAPKLYGPETNNVIDWRETNLIQTIAAHQPVARKTPARAGVPGETVTGRKIEPRKVRDDNLPIGRGTKVDDIDPNLLLAAMDGAVRLEGNHVMVDPVLHLPRDVDFSIGNISFQGSIQLGGNVLPGFQVRATGDIRIGGYVEGAIVESGESVWIGQGVIGQTNETSIRAGKNVTAKFARNASITAGGDITLQLEAVLCQLHSGGTVSVGSKERKLGRIVGGQVVATKAVFAVDVGSESESATHVAVVPSGPSAAEQKVAEKREKSAKLRQDHKSVLAEVARLLNIKVTSSSSWTPAQEDLLSRLSAAANQIEEDLGYLDDHPVTIPVTDLPRVVVYGVLFPGAQVVIGRTPRKFTKKLERVQLVLTDESSSIISLALQ